MKINARNTAVFLAAACVAEFLLVPYSYLFVFPMIQGAGYLGGILMLSLPRVVLVLLLVLLMKELGGLSLWLAALIYAAVLVTKFFVSEVYIQPGNLYAMGTALLPYAIGLILLVIGGFLLWPRHSRALSSNGVTQ